MSLFNGKQEGKIDKAGFKLLKVKDNKVNVGKYDGDSITYLGLLYYSRDFNFVLQIVTLQGTQHYLSSFL